MITTDFVPGSPCWLDLGAPEVTAAASFYGAVFGWQFESSGPDGGEFGLFRMDGKIVAGLGPLTEEGARSAWMIYFYATDADAVAETVRRAGGAVRLAPFDADSEGRIAQLTDPQGGEFAVWQAGNTRGFEVADGAGALCWIELYTTDAAGAKEFYGTLFGWTTEDTPLPGGGAYSMITPAGAAQERMHGGIIELSAGDLPGGRPYWHPVFAVEDCDATVSRVTGNGGSVQMGPEDAEGVGRLAVCLDPSGADFVVLTPSGS